jgi:hypothetical protein
MDWLEHGGGCAMIERMNSLALTPSEPLPAWARLVQEDVRYWLEQAVIGLNLCPFAKAVVVHERLRYRITDAREPEPLLAVLEEELLNLASADPQVLETTLLIAPWALPDFLDFNDFLGECDRLLVRCELDGVLQVADFHPNYQFANTDVNDPQNLTNRSPYPVLHLLREDSIDRAVQAYPDAASIYERNIELLEQLGHEGWGQLGIQARCPWMPAGHPGPEETV